MTTKEFIKLVQDTRDAQKVYYRAPKHPENMKWAALQKSRDLEKQLDDALKSISVQVYTELQNRLF